MGKSARQVRSLSGWWRLQGKPNLGEVGERRKSPNRPGAYFRVAWKAP